MSACPAISPILRFERLCQHAREPAVMYLAAAMTVAANANAMIIDLRNNGGGDPASP